MQKKYFKKLQLFCSISSSSLSSSLCSTYVQDCTQLHILQIKRFFVDLARKTAAARIFCTQRFAVTSLSFSLTRRGFRIQQILRKLQKIIVLTICRILQFLVTYLLFSRSREGFRTQVIPRKVPKIFPFPHFNFLYAFIT